jgi:hypothetical protein
MWKVISMITCIILLAACSREQIQNGITASLRGACAQNSANCTVHCPIGQVGDQQGDCRKEQ